MKLAKNYAMMLMAVLMALTVSSCGGDDNDEIVTNSDYVGSWYASGVNDSKTTATIIYFVMNRNTYKMTVYNLTGSNLDRETGKTNTVTKVVNSGSIVVEANNILRMTDYADNQTDIMKYSIIDNQLILTDTKTGTVYGFFKITSETQAAINNLEKIAV